MDKKKELQRQQEDAAFAHGLWWVGGAIVVELLVLMMYHFVYNYRVDQLARAEITYAIMQGALVVAPIVFVLAAWKGFTQLKKDGKICHVVEGALGLSAAVAFVVAMAFTFKVDGCSVMMMFVPAAGVLAFLFFIYQHDFFYSAAFSGMGALVLWMVWQITLPRAIVIYIAVAKIVIFAALLSWVTSKLKKSGGTLTLLGHKVRFLPQDTVYPILYASFALTAVMVVAGFLVGGYVAYYLIYALAAWIFALVVYYTVRML